MNTIIQSMTAGAIFSEPEIGDRRVIVGEIHTFAPEDPNAVNGYVVSRGKLVQEFGPRYTDEGWELEGGGVWMALCPLCDYAELYG